MTLVVLPQNGLGAGAVAGAALGGNDLTESNGGDRLSLLLLGRLIPGVEVGAAVIEAVLGAGGASLSEEAGTEAVVDVLQLGVLLQPGLDLLVGLLPDVIGALGQRHLRHRLAGLLVVLLDLTETPHAEGGLVQVELLLVALGAEAGGIVAAGGGALQMDQGPHAHHVVLGEQHAAGALQMHDVLAQGLGALALAGAGHHEADLGRILNLLGSPLLPGAADDVGLELRQAAAPGLNQADGHALVDVQVGHLGGVDDVEVHVAVGNVLRGGDVAVPHDAPGGDADEDADEAGGLGLHELNLMAGDGLVLVPDGLQLGAGGGRVAHDVAKDIALGAGGGLDVELITVGVADAIVAGVGGSRGGIAAAVQVHGSHATSICGLSCETVEVHAIILLSNCD